MFGFWFSIVGLIFGILCSYMAKEKKRATKEWFMLGFIFSFMALGILYALRSNDQAENNDELHGHTDLFIPIESN